MGIWLLLAGALLLGVSRAQREVTIQQGPLYRTVGSHITIWCKVRGYQGPSEQSFQFSIYLPSAPDREVQMVSTKDPAFSYAIFSQRVRAGDIYIERVTGDHTLLHIRQLQERDAGEYECHTPNTDPKFYGSYSAKVNLRVLPDSLQVSMAPQHVERTEGSSLEVTCEVMKNSSQHTHLSLSWLLNTDEDIDVLSLSRDFVLVPGASFSERFRSGDIRLDKLGLSSYRLSIQRLRRSDAGEIFCRGSEWIQDPDGRWTKITEKTSEKTVLKVSALQGEDFRVEIEKTDDSIGLRRALEVTCSISGYSLIGGRFHVTWLLDDSTMATWDSSGVSSYGTKYSTRGSQGQISVRRRDQKTWTLRISPASGQDGGSYLCDVTEEGTQRRRQSLPLTVSIETPGSPVRSLSLRSEVSDLYEGDSLRLLCQVSGFSGPLDLAFLRSAGRWVEVVSLRPNGEVVVSGEYRQRHRSGRLSAQRLSDGLHSLTLDDVVEGDGGAYGCRVTEQRAEETWSNDTYDSDRVQIQVQPLGAVLQAELMSPNQRSVSGAPARLICRLRGPHSLQDKLLSWSWDFLPSGGTFRSLVNVSGGGGLSWGAPGPDYQLSILGTSSTLRIHRVQRHHQGGYRCRAQSRGPGATSITMSLSVLLPAARLSVDTADQVLFLGGGEDTVTVSCTILAVTPGTVLHVSWFAGSPGSAVNVLNITGEGLTSHRPAASSGLLSERVSPDTFLLRILRLRLPASFFCAVRELLQDSGEWLPLAERTSGVTRVLARTSDKSLKVPKQNVSRAVAAGDDLVLRCPLEEVRSAAALYSVSWYYQAAPLSYPSLLYRAGWEGVTEYPEALAGRLQVVAPARGNYSLILHSVGQEDAGVYHCQVQEWRLQDDGWRLEASDTSGFLQLNVSTPDDGLIVNRTALTLEAPEGSSLALPCQVVSTSGPGSALSVTWWRLRAPGPQLLLNASHLGRVLYPSAEGGRLQYEQTSELTLQLRILRTHPPDTGDYYCRVQEWVQAPRGGWSRAGEQRGGNVSVTIQAAGGSSSPVCPPLWPFYLSGVVVGLFLLVALGWWLQTRWRSRGRASSLWSRKDLWSPVKTSENEADRGREEESGPEGAEHIQLRSTEDISR